MGATDTLYHDSPVRRDTVRMRVLLAAGCALLLAGCGGDRSARLPEPDVATEITVTSPAFVDGGPIPAEYTCRGAGRSPELSWRGVPAGAASLAVVVTDPDAPGGTFVHWLLYDVRPADGSLPAGAAAPPGAKEADNSGGKPGWYAPCPPSGVHHYVFTVFALERAVTGRSTQDVLDDIGRAALARGRLTGLVSAS
jgi:Raf kinase inhibitor-like YbhB/YbcL family protein